MTGRPPCELQDAKANRVELLCSRPAVSRPCLASGDIFLSSRVQSHLPCVLRGFSLCPDRVGFVRLATLLAVSHVCQGKVSVHSTSKTSPHGAHPCSHPHCTQKCLLWHQSSGPAAAAANLFYFRDCLAAPEGGKYEFLSPIYQTFIIVCLQTECQHIKC